MPVLCLLLSGCLAGCVSYRPAPLQLDRSARQFESRTLADASLHRCIRQQLGRPLSWPPAQWNLRLLSLAAGCNNPDLAVTRAQAASARAAAVAAGARLNPALQFPFDYNTDHAGAGRPFTTGPQLDIPVETAGKRADRIRKAQHQAQAARLQLAAASWNLRSRVRNALIALYTQTQRSTLLDRQVRLQQQILAMQRERVRVGAAAQPDLSLAMQRWTRAQSDLLATRQSLVDARSTLASAVGVPLSAVDGIRLDLSEFDRQPAAIPPSRARRAAILHRADLLGALAEYEAAQSALQLEVARQYPDLYLGLGYTYDEGANKISLGLASITLPVFSRNQGAIARAAAQRSEAAARTEALQDRIIQSLQHALARYRESRQAESVVEQQVRAAKQQLDSQLHGFAAGNVGRLALTQARADYLASEALALNARVAVQQAAGLLEDAMQQPLPTTPEPEDSR